MTQKMRDGIRNMLTRKLAKLREEQMYLDEIHIDTLERLTENCDDEIERATERALVLKQQAMRQYSEDWNDLECKARKIKMKIKEVMGW